MAILIYRGCLFVFFAENQENFVENSVVRGRAEMRKIPAEKSKSLKGNEIFQKCPDFAEGTRLFVTCCFEKLIAMLSLSH